MIPPDPSIAHLRVGDFAIVRWPEVKRWIAGGDPSMAALPEFLARLGAQDLFLFTNGPGAGAWFLVETDEQKAQLALLTVDPRRVFTRADLLTEFAKCGHDPATLETVPLLNLLKRSIPTKEPTVTDAATPADDEIPPDDRNLWRAEPKTVEKLDGPGNPWLEPFSAWMSRQSPETQTLIPQGSDFWLNDAWMIGDDTLPCALLLSTTEQAATVAGINSLRLERKLDTIPAWGPAELAPYFGDALVVIPPEQQALTIFQLHRDATSTLAAGIRVGEQRISARLANLATAAPLTSAALLALTMARELYGRSLLDLNADELEHVHIASGKLLVAVGLAKGPLASDLLPKPLPKRKPGDDQPPPGQYI